MHTYAKPKVSLLITDLDNTLYDWVTYFAEAFTALIDQAEKILSIPRARLLDDFKAVHQQHHNTEHPFALLEIQSVAEKFAHLSRKEKKEALDPAFYAFNKKRKEKLCLYKGVSEALQSIQATGCVIVGHTEATVPNALFRLSSLELLGYFRRLYAIEPPQFDHPDPQWLIPQYLPNGFVHMVTTEKRKPNPFLLLDICSDLSVEPSHAVYVGDSLTRDMSMAIQAGVRSAWAKYGSDFSADNWNTLVRVSHWTDEDVKRERDLRTKFGSAEPDVVLHAYSDLLSAFQFEAPCHHMGAKSGGL
jgi:FMN phosphatase YigB (HAD superfamily)